MQVWAPPTPPQDENDLYIDYSLGFMYEQSLMPESQLPPVYIPKETNKRLRLDTTIGMLALNIPDLCPKRPAQIVISYFHFQPVNKKFERKKVSIFRVLFLIVRPLQSLNCVVN